MTKIFTQEELDIQFSEHILCCGGADSLCRHPECVKCHFAWPCPQFRLITQLQRANNLLKVAREVMEYLDETDGSPCESYCDCLYGQLRKAIDDSDADINGFEEILDD